MKQIAMVNHKKTSKTNDIFNKLNLGYSMKQDDVKNKEMNINKEISSELPDNNLLITNKLKGYSKIQELKLINIRLASSQRILEWAEKVLPNGKVFGEVLNANTLHYKTFKPHKGGLFCERIFGPLKDFECACGIKQRPADSENYVQTLLDTKKSQRNFCPNCDVEYTWSVIRRYQLGYIKLISPVTHLWYLKANPSYLSLLLDIRKKDLESIIYCIQIITLEYYWKPLYAIQLNLNPSSLFTSYKKFFKPIAENEIQKFVQPKIQKKKQKLEKRKELTIRKQAIYFQSSIKKPLELLETNSLQTKIDHLEKSFKLSSTDFYPGRLAKISNVTRFLKQRISRRIKKQSFLVLSKKILYDFYLKNLNAVFNRAFANREKASLVIPITPKNSFNNINQTSKNTNNLKNSKISSNRNSSFTFIIKKSLDLKYNNSKTGKIEFISNSEKLKFNSYLSDFKFKSRDKKPLFLKFKDKDFLLTLNKENLTKKIFLNHFSKCIRLTNLQNSWISIYKTPTNSVKFLSNILQSNTKLPLAIRFGKFFKNCSFLYLLYIIQENNDSFFKKELNKYKNFQGLGLILKNVSVENKMNSDLLNRLNNYMKKEEKLSIDFLSKFLQTNVFLHRTEKDLIFFEIEEVMNNLNNEFIVFTNIVLNIFIRNFLKCKTLEKNQSSIFKCENSGIICLVEPEKKEETYFFNQNKDVLNNRYLNSLYKRDQKKMELFFTKLKLDKKIFQFVTSTDLYPRNYNFYLKHLIQTTRNLTVFKNQKTKIIQKLCNRIYTLSYSKGWENERDWKYFLYYNTNHIEIADKAQFYYQTYFDNITFLNPSNNTNIPVLGANLIQNLLFQYEGTELKKMAKHHQNILPKFNRFIRSQKQSATTKLDFMQLQKLLQKRDQFIRRLKLLRKLYRKNSKTTSMILKTLPVLPPDLRPILKLQNQIAASDLNRFYQRIIYRNERLKKFLKMNSVLLNSEPGFEIKYGQRLLQEAVDNLIQNGKGGVAPETNSRGQPLKSLSEILKGKQGRFRQYLLGKRVDYSGRSVIVVGPSLKIYQCGLPFEMAMELFLPFLIKRIFQYQLARTVVGAKTILKTQKKITWDLLEEIMYNHPILLNRAPTLHRLGIQAFQPKLIEGRAILLHPLVCPAFNADFDGDQMAVHVPITVEARTEAWKLMLARNHLISPATGEPMLLPSQDMVLGCYYLTTETFQYSRIHSGRPFKNSTRFYFSNMNEVLQFYLQEKIHLQTPIWLKWNSDMQMGQQVSSPLELRLESNGYLLELRPKTQKRLNETGQSLMIFIRTTAGRVLFNQLVEGIIKK